MVKASQTLKLQKKIVKHRENAQCSNWTKLCVIDIHPKTFIPTEYNTKGHSKAKNWCNTKINLTAKLKIKELKNEYSL